MREQNDPETPAENSWHWVSSDGQDWWPAKRLRGSVGGWSNEDTWEDFDKEVRFWKRIDPPTG
jgi:hypothetical protein